MRCSRTQGEALQIKGEQARFVPQGGTKVRKGVQAEERATLPKVKHFVASSFLLAGAVHSGYIPIYAIAIGYWLASMGNMLTA